MKQYEVVATKQYRKDAKRLFKAGYKRKKLEAVIDRLASGSTLPSRYHDHVLRGELYGMRACHIEPDWLLIYAKDDTHLILLLIGTGDHRHTLGIE